jgi:hypothetical protein
MAKKARQATDAGITIESISGRRKKWPLYQWRQAIRTGLNWYWGEYGWLTIDFQIGELDRGRKVKFTLAYQHTCVIDAWFMNLCHYKVSHTAAEVVHVSDAGSAEHVAAQLLRFAWNRKAEVLVVPVRKAAASFDIPDNRVTFFVNRGDLQVCGGNPPIAMSE